MDLSIEDAHPSDLLDESSFHLPSLNMLLGINLNLDWIKCIKLEPSFNCHWVWASPEHKTTILAMVYDHFNMNRNIDEPWSSWTHIWKLALIPRVKTFIWKLAHGKLTTGALLYQLNIGPFSLCPFYGLEEETIAHLILELLQN